jgi:hypothetical protein
VEGDDVRAGQAGPWGAHGHGEKQRPEISLRCVVPLVQT